MIVPTICARGVKRVAAAALLVAWSATWPLAARAESSRDNLVRQMVSALEAELPSDIRGIGVMRFDNPTGAPLDIDLLREDIELELIGEDRFQFVNRELLEAALQEMELCNGMACFMDPEMLQEFGHAKGIDALILAQVIDSSTRYPGLGDTDYFVTVLLQVMSTKTASIVWQKEVTGVNTENVVDVLGEMPAAQAVTREQALGREVSRFLKESSKLRETGIRTVSLIDFENRSGKQFDTSAMFRHMASAIVSGTGLKLVDRAYMEEYLKEQNLWWDRLTEASQRKSIGQLYGIDAFIYGSIREVEPGRLVCVVRVNDVETNIDVDAKKLTGTAENMEWSLANMLRNVGPSEFTSNPSGAEVTLDGQPLGVTPLQRQLSNGDHEVAFSLFGYQPVTKRIRCQYGQGQKVHADLQLAFARVTVRSIPGDAELWVNGEPQAGRTPVSGIELPYGQHQFRVKRSMCKDKTEKLEVNQPAHEFTLRMEVKTRSGAIWRSIFFPGLGQHYKGQHGKGWLFTLAAAGSGAFVYLNESARTDAVDEYEAAREEYLSAITQTQMDEAYAVMEDKWQEAEDKKKLRDIGWMALAGVWTLNVIDAALGWPAADAGVAVVPAMLNDGTPAVALSFGR